LVILPGLTLSKILGFWKFVIKLCCKVVADGRAGDLAYFVAKILAH